MSAVAWVTIITCLLLVVAAMVLGVSCCRSRSCFALRWTSGRRDLDLRRRIEERKP